MIGILPAVSMVAVVMVIAMMVAAIPPLNDHTTNNFMAVMASVLDPDRMTASQLAVIETASAMIDKTHVPAVAIARVLVVAKAEADEVVTIALVEPVAMIRESRGWQDRSYYCEDYD